MTFRSDILVIRLTQIAVVSNTFCPWGEKNRLQIIKMQIRKLILIFNNKSEAPSVEKQTRLFTINRKLPFKNMHMHKGIVVNYLEELQEKEL